MGLMYRPRIHVGRGIVRGDNRIVLWIPRLIDWSSLQQPNSGIPSGPVGGYEPGSETFDDPYRGFWSYQEGQLAWNVRNMDQVGISTFIISSPEVSIDRDKK